MTSRLFHRPNLARAIERHSWISDRVGLAGFVLVEWRFLQIGSFLLPWPPVDSALLRSCLPSSTNIVMTCRIRAPVAEILQIFHTPAMGASEMYWISKASPSLIDISMRFMSMGDSDLVVYEPQGLYICSCLKHICCTHTTNF